MSSYRSVPHAMADCLTCGQDGVRHGSLDDKPDLQRRWARAHVQTNPTHTVHMTTEQVRVYKGDDA